MVRRSVQTLHYPCSEWDPGGPDQPYLQWLCLTTSFTVWQLGEIRALYVEGFCSLPHWKCSSGFSPEYVHCSFCTCDCYASGYHILSVFRIILVFFCLVLVVWYQLTVASKSEAQTQKRDDYQTSINLSNKINLEVMYTWKLAQLGCKDAAFVV